MSGIWITPYMDSVIFDLDGTLWDGSNASAVAWNRAMQELGLDHKRIRAVDIADISGKTPEEFLPIIFPDLSRREGETFYSICSAYEAEEILNGMGTLRDGVERFLERISQEYPVFLVSNCQRDYMDAFLEWSGMEDLIVDSMTHGDNGRSKAENIGILMSGHDLKRPVHIGDTEEDREGAREAGVGFIKIAPAFKAELDPGLPSLNEITDRILRGSID